MCILIGQFWPWSLAYKGRRAKFIKLKLVRKVAATNVISGFSPDSADLNENQAIGEASAKVLCELVSHSSRDDVKPSAL